MNPKIDAAWKKFTTRLADIRKRAKAIATRTEAEQQQQKLDAVRRSIGTV